MFIAARGDNSYKRCFSNTVFNLKYCRKFGRSSRSPDSRNNFVFLSKQPLLKLTPPVLLLDLFMTQRQYESLSLSWNDIGCQLFRIYNGDFSLCLALRPQIAHLMEWSCWRSLALGRRTRLVLGSVCHTCPLTISHCYLQVTVVTPPSMEPLCLKMLDTVQLSGLEVIQRIQASFGTGSKNRQQCCKVR